MPRLITNDVQQAVWRWDQQEPFGVNVADENPSGLCAFDLPLRLPGQYFDKETNLHYNDFRDYDLSIGRYVYRTYLQRMSRTIRSSRSPLSFLG